MMKWLKNLPNSTAFWLALVGLVLVCSIVLPAVSWGWLRSGASESGMESHSTTVRNIGFIVAGVLALVFAVWRGVLAQRQAETAQRQSETSQRQSETAEQGLLNERYQKGAEMLGSDVLSVRLGGIYALQRLAEEHPEQYHVQIMELFCAFVRFPTGATRIALHSEVDDEQDEQRLILRPDVQDVMRAIGSRSSKGIDLERSRKIRLYLRDAKISNLQTANANLSRAWLTNADLSNTILVRADLSGARLRQAKLHCAQLGMANLSRAILDDAILSDARIMAADLSHARLAGAQLTGANLAGANLTSASFSGLRGITRGSPATGLTQAQLDVARSDPDNPPNLEGVLDAETGEQLVWQGKPLDDDSTPDG